MASSMLKTAIIIGLLSVGTQALAMPNNSSCKCSNKAAVTSCNKAEVANPTWWRWLTDGSGSQFHFFDLIELLHNSDDDKVAVNNRQEQNQVDS